MNGRYGSGKNWNITICQHRSMDGLMWETICGRREAEKALAISPSWIMPIIVNEMNLEQLPDDIQKGSIQNVSNIISQQDKDKAKAIVEELIKFYLRNNK